VQLQTQIPISPAANLIDYESQVLLLGSCFTENIGNKLTYFQFRNWQNPFGVIFNPVSIQKLLQKASEQALFTKADIFQQDEIWYSFLAHGSCSSLDDEGLVILLNEKLSLLKKAVSESSHIVITLGTAWVYNHLATNEIVANCHKVPQQHFNKSILSVAEIEQALYQIISITDHLNPNAQVIFTISPVRHIKDGMIGNSQSKAHLITAVQRVVANTSTSYFPAFEILIDELRDYRYYASDLLHPNEIAIEYLWNRFKKAWISETTESLQQQIQIIQTGLNHRPFQPSSKKHQAFLSNLKLQIETVTKELPWADFNERKRA